MWGIVTICPGDATADRHFDRRRIERESLDLDCNRFHSGALAGVSGRRRFLSRFCAAHLIGGFNQTDADQRLVAIGAEPRDPRVTRVVELPQPNDDLGLRFTLVSRDDAADVAASGVGINLIGAQVDIDGMPAVDDLLQRHVDNRETGLHWDGSGSAGPIRTVPDVGYVSKWDDHVAKLRTRAGMDVRGMGLRFIVLSG